MFFSLLFRLIPGVNGVRSGVNNICVGDTIRTMGKIKSFTQIVKEVTRLKQEGKTVGLVTGCFDIIHYGHVRMLRFAKNNCDVIVVGLDNDKTVEATLLDNKSPC